MSHVSEHLVLLEGLVWLSPLLSLFRNGRKSRGGARAVLTRLRLSPLNRLQVIWLLALTTAPSFCTIIWGLHFPRLPISLPLHISVTGRHCHLMTRLKIVTGSGTDDSSDVRYFLKWISRLLVCDAASLGGVRRFVRLSMIMKSTNR